MQGRDPRLGLGVLTLTPVMATNLRSAEVGPEPVRRGPSLAEVDQAEMRQLSTLVAASGAFCSRGEDWGSLKAPYLWDERFLVLSLRTLTSLMASVGPPPSFT